MKICVRQPMEKHSWGGQGLYRAAAPRNNNNNNNNNQKHFYAHKTYISFDFMMTANERATV
jgi:hypothetical protein